jgi:hypothetical protein
MTEHLEYFRGSLPRSATDFTIRARDVAPLHSSCLTPAGVTVVQAAPLTWGS